MPIAIAAEADHEATAAAAAIAAAEIASAAVRVSAEDEAALRIGGVASVSRWFVRHFEDVPDLVGLRAFVGERLRAHSDVRGLFGFTAENFVVRLSDRKAWMDFLTSRGCDEAASRIALACADKLEREPEEKLNAKLAPAGLSVADLKAFIAGGSPEAFAPVLEALAARGLTGFVQPDLSIVRGLAYYTGVVFEIFDRSKNLRALAGGGRDGARLARRVS